MRLNGKRIDTEILDSYFNDFVKWNKKQDSYRLNKKISAARKTELLKLYFYSQENLIEMRNNGLI